MLRRAAIALTAAAFSVSGASAQDILDLNIAKDLLLPCQEADNDPRDGYVVALECNQFIRGFIAGVEATGADGFAFCLPETNRDDALRRAFVHWVHGSFSARKSMPVADAMLAMLESEFSCE